MKDDERAFLAECQRCAANTPDREPPRDIYQRMGINWKRACYLLGKWTDKGWYDYGVNVDLGWMTDKGMQVKA